MRERRTCSPPGCRHILALTLTTTLVHSTRIATPALPFRMATHDNGITASADKVPVAPGKRPQLCAHRPPARPGLAAALLRLAHKTACTWAPARPCSRSRAASITRAHPRTRVSRGTRGLQKRRCIPCETSRGERRLRFRTCMCSTISGCGRGSLGTMGLCAGARRAGVRRM